MFSEEHPDAKPSFGAYTNGGFAVAVIDCRVGDDYFNILGLVLQAWNSHSFGRLVEPVFVPVTDRRIQSDQAIKRSMTTVHISPQIPRQSSSLEKAWILREVPSQDSGYSLKKVHCIPYVWYDPRTRILRSHDSLKRLSLLQFHDSQPIG